MTGKDVIEDFVEYQINDISSSVKAIKTAVRELGLIKETIACHINQDTEEN